MGEGLLQTIRQVGIFVICAQMIMHFKPAESYGKYIRLLVSVMVLVQLFVPIMDIFFRSNVGNFSGRISYYEEILSVNMEDISLTCETAEQMLNQMTLEEIKTRINNQSNENNEINQNHQNNQSNQTNESTLPKDGELESDILQQLDLIPEDSLSNTEQGEKDKKEIVIKKIEVLTDD